MHLLMKRTDLYITVRNAVIVSKIILHHLKVQDRRFMVSIMRRRPEKFRLIPQTFHESSDISGAGRVHQDVTVRELAHSEPGIVFLQDRSLQGHEPDGYPHLS